MRRMAYSTTGFSLYSDGRGMVSVFGYGPRNMAMLSSLRSIAIVASLCHDGDLHSPADLRYPPAKRALAMFEGGKQRTKTRVTNGGMAKWLKVGVGARKDYCTMRTRYRYCLR